jgi:hypothetical protein
MEGPEPVQVHLAEAALFLRVRSPLGRPRVLHKHALVPVLIPDLILVLVLQIDQREAPRGGGPVCHVHVEAELMLDPAPLRTRLLGHLCLLYLLRPVCLLLWRTSAVVRVWASNGREISCWRDERTSTGWVASVDEPLQRPAIHALRLASLLVFLILLVLFGSLRLYCCRVRDILRVLRPLT